MAITFGKVKNEYTKLLETMEVKESWKDRVNKQAAQVLKNKDAYMAVSKATGVPWDVIGVIHILEGNGDFTTHLHNGDSLQKRTRNVPRGRPLGEPPFTWNESAIDAIKYDGLDKVSDWSDESICFELEKYNGLGYRTRNTGVNSPYLWSGTNHYVKGKFVEDGSYERNHVSKQVGCIPLLMRVREISVVKVADLAPTSRKLTIIQRFRQFIGWLTATVTGLFTMDNFENAKRIIDPFKDFLWNYKFVIAGGLAIGIFTVLKYIEHLTVQDYKEGRYTPSKEDEDV